MLSDLYRISYWLAIPKAEIFMLLVTSVLIISYMRLYLCTSPFLHTTGQMSNPFLSAPVRCLYSVFYLWILFFSYRIKMEISKILIATIVAATLISQTHSASLQMRVTDVIPKKTANAIQRVWMSYLVRFPRWSYYSQLKVIKLILTEIAILEIYSTYLTYRFPLENET